jgi:hypothetical protein
MRLYFPQNAVYFVISCFFFLVQIIFTFNINQVQKFKYPHRKIKDNCTINLKNETITSKIIHLASLRYVHNTCLKSHSFIPRQNFINSVGHGQQHNADRAVQVTTNSIYWTYWSN